MTTFVFRNQTVEAFLGYDDVTYSGYDDISMIPSEVDRYIWFYQVSVNADSAQLAQEIQSYSDKLDIVLSGIDSNKPFVIFSLVNLFSVRLTGDETAVGQAIAAFNNHASALGLNGENGPCATIEAMKTFGYDKGVNADTRLFWTYYYGQVYHDKTGETVTLDDGSPLVYYPMAVKLDLSNDPYEKTAGARMRKYEIDLAAMSDGQLRRNDIVLFRFADVLLMRCEAMLRDGRAGTEADALLNRVRTRSHMDSRIATLDNVLEERMLELAWEGWRRNDLIRFGLFTRPYSDRPQIDADRMGYTLVFPIPGETLSACGSAQNPGY